TAATRAIPHATARHLRADVELQLEADAFLVAEVRGARGLSPLVQPRPAGDEGDAGVLPYALTNPIFVDVDGNGVFDAPLPREIEIRKLGFREKPPL
ncbi:MAG: hypothetical protein JRE43_05065, partial [Deltaproteobacteria bacterium]|nr:hypothetical protein [Deltaproteobacteria bacterium]